jgi:hypothetical protein
MDDKMNEIIKVEASRLNKEKVFSSLHFSHFNLNSENFRVVNLNICKMKSNFLDTSFSHLNCAHFKLKTDISIA